MELSNKAEYTEFLEQIKHRIHSKQINALRSVNRELIDLYFEIGEAILRK